MSLQMKNGLKYCWFLFSHYNENIKFVRSAALAYNQLCSFTTVWVTSLIRINHKVLCLEVDINILVFMCWNSSVQLGVCDTSMNQALKHILKYLTKGPHSHKKLSTHIEANEAAVLITSENQIKFSCITLYLKASKFLINKKRIFIFLPYHYSPVIRLLFSFLCVDLKGGCVCLCMSVCVCVYVWILLVWGFLVL